MGNLTRTQKYEGKDSFADGQQESSQSSHKIENSSPDFKKAKTFADSPG